MMRFAYFSLFLFLTSCFSSEPPTLTTFSDTVMTIEYRIMIGSPLNNEQRERVQNVIDQTFQEVDHIYNKWNPNSELSRLNQAKANVKVPLSPPLERFLKETETIVELTQGRFDPTIEPISQLWKTYLEQGKLPGQSEIAKAARCTGWDHIHINDGIFWKDKDETQLDLGGIAKGYAIDLLLERLHEIGHHDLYVEWGGEIRVTGEHPSHRPWRVGVNALSKDIAIIDLDSQAIASSGDYLQFWMVDGEMYTHVINPTTSMPLQVTADTICSATVQAQSCMLADALATTAMLFPSPEEASAWLSQIDGIESWIVSRKNLE